MTLNLARLGPGGLTALPSFRQTLPPFSHHTVRPISSTNVNRNVVDNAFSDLGKRIIGYRDAVNLQLDESTGKVSELTRQNHELTCRIAELTDQQNESTGLATETTTEDTNRASQRNMMMEAITDILLHIENPDRSKLRVEFCDFSWDMDLEARDEKQEMRKNVLL